MAKKLAQRRGDDASWKRRASWKMSLFVVAK